MFFFFPPCYIQRVKMVPVSIILNMVSGLPPFQSSATDEGKFLGSGFLMPPKLVAFQALLALSHNLAFIKVILTHQIYFNIFES